VLLPFTLEAWAQFLVFLKIGRKKHYIEVLKSKIGRKNLYLEKLNS
jgi:hypothetical protein